MYKISEDVELELQKKYPNLDTKQFIHDLFELVLKKCFEGGSTTIREFGKFVCYKTFSNRVGREQVRFKFKPPQSLIKKIKNDSYILESLPIIESVPFTKKHSDICSDKKDQRLLNKYSRINSEKMGKQHTQEELAKQEVLKLLGDE